MTPNEIAGVLRQLAEHTENDYACQCLQQAAAYLIELECLVDKVDQLTALMKQVEILELELKMAKS